MHNDQGFSRSVDFFRLFQNSRNPGKSGTIRIPAKMEPRLCSGPARSVAGLILCAILFVWPGRQERTYLIAEVSKNSAKFGDLSKSQRHNPFRERPEDCEASPRLKSGISRDTARASSIGYHKFSWARVGGHRGRGECLQSGWLPVFRLVALWVSLHLQSGVPNCKRGTALCHLRGGHVYMANETALQQLFGHMKEIFGRQAGFKPKKREK